MPRSIWSGSISFGLVNVPVKLVTAVSPKSVSFHQLHDKDGVRIRQKRVCPADGEEVSYDHIVKGYEVAPDQYVRIDPEELAALEPEKSKTIDILNFVDLNQIDPLYYEKSYYLVPDKGAGKSYSLLFQAMEEANRVAIAKVVIRTKEYLVALRPIGKILTLSTLHYADEVIPQEDAGPVPESVKVSEREVKMAKQLIDSLYTDFEPDAYHDEYRERVLELVEKKAEGEEIAVQPAAKEPAKVVNLLDALEKSLKEAQKGKKPGAKTAASKGSKRKAAGG